MIQKDSSIEEGNRNGDQLAIIRKLARYGGNGIYVLAVRTHGGDATKDAKGVAVHLSPMPTQPVDRTGPAQRL